MSCCGCTCPHGSNASASGNSPLICLVPREGGKAAPAGAGGGRGKPRPATAPAADGGLQLFDDDYLRGHFDLPKRALYLDPFRRPLITFPMTQEMATNFNQYRKTKINQQILDGAIDPSEAISAPSVFPYSTSQKDAKKQAEENEEIIYILQLPDWEFKCPVHNETIRTPRFIWHSCKKTSSKEKEGGLKRGGGPCNKPKPWLLSRHTDFDLLSQW